MLLMKPKGLHQMVGVCGRLWVPLFGPFAQLGDDLGGFPFAQLNTRTVSGEVGAFF